MRRLHLSPLTCDPDVQRLQLLLNSELVPSPRLYPDGVLGRRTSAALKQFQESRQLKPSGALDADVWSALNHRAVPVAHVPVATNVSGVPWMTIAEAELGIEENRSTTTHTARILEYHQTTTLRASDDETPWCASFVNWVLITAGIPGTNSAAAISWLKWGYPLKQGVHGAVTVLKKKGGGPDKKSGSSSGNHVGFCVSEAGNRIRVLGGNQGGGRKVCISTYSTQTHEILGYRWPYPRGPR